jgi:hypothetical protein
MNKTFTPELDPETLGRLDDYAERFRDLFSRPSQAAWCGVYLRGLIQDGDRKSVEPIANRIPLPDGLDVSDPDQALQQFLGQSPWDERAVWRRYREVMAGEFADPAGIFVIDDTSFPKQGQHSVGVQRQHCGALGKKANCQCAVSVHYVSPKGHYPLDLRPYLPGGWLGVPKRLDKAGVPEGERRPLTKARSRRSCSTGSAARGCRAGSSWPTAATASPARSATAWPGAGCIIWSGSPTRGWSSPRSPGGSRRRPPPAAGRGRATAWPRARPGR